MVLNKVADFALSVLDDVKSFRQIKSTYPDGTLYLNPVYVYGLPDDARFAVKSGSGTGMIRWDQVPDQIHVYIDGFSRYKQGVLVVCHPPTEHYNVEGQPLDADKAAELQKSVKGAAVVQNLSPLESFLFGI